MKDRPDWPKELIRYGAQVLTRSNLDVVIENLPALASAPELAAEA